MKKFEQIQEKISLVIGIGFILFITLAYIIGFINRANSNWSCSNITSYDGNWDNDYVCKNKKTDKVIYVSKEKAYELMNSN